MKKLVIICQNNIEKVITNSQSSINSETVKILDALQEGLIACTSKVPSGEGFPFDLPTVNYAHKLIMSKIFFDEFCSSDIRSNLKEIELLYGYFVELRLILENVDFSSKEIINEIKILLRQTKSQQNIHPKLEVIRQRLKKYWKYLFHCYDDKRIPRTNLGIERYFNHFKRIKRRRSGIKSTPTYFTHEGKPIIQIENITNCYSSCSSANKFIEDFTSKRLLVSKEQLTKQAIIRSSDKSFLKIHYKKKISLLTAEFTFQKIADKISLI